MIISLTGFMGCGKSSVGRRLSQLLCCPFADLDSVIEDRCGCTIPEIFAGRGEGEFRRIEKEVLEDIIRNYEKQTPGQSLILALGGGAVMTPDCEKMVHEQTTCIYLKATIDELVTRLTGEAVGRPLLEASDLHTRILELMLQRSETYERVAHMTIDTDDKSIGEIAKEIFTTLILIPPPST